MHGYVCKCGMRDAVRNKGYTWRDVCVSEYEAFFLVRPGIVDLRYRCFILIDMESQEFGM